MEIRRGLRRFAQTGDARVVPGALVRRLGVSLDDLAAARKPADLDLPGCRLHRLRADRAGEWSGRVSGTWRLVSRFEAGDAVEKSGMVE